MAKNYAISDLHGMHDIYDQICEMLEPDDTVYFLGDAGDRGYANWQTIKDIYKDPQWIYLKGNHEDMLVKGLRETMDKNSWIRGKDEYGLWMWNGGHDTENGWYKDGGDISWITKLDNLSLTADYTNDKGITFHMSHAGFTCGKPSTMLTNELVWSRSHFFDYWDEEKYKYDICIHGHTPLEYLVKEFHWNNYECAKWDIHNPEARIYCEGHKIDIDNGVFYTGSTVLYDLDEMKAIPIFDREFKNTVEC